MEDGKAGLPVRGEKCGGLCIGTFDFSFGERLMIEWWLLFVDPCNDGKVLFGLSLKKLNSR